MREALFDDLVREHCISYSMISKNLKLVCTLLNTRVLGTSMAAKWSFSLCTYIPRMNVMLDFICIAPVDLPGAHKKQKMQNEKFLLKVGLVATALRSEVWCHTNWANRA